MGSTRGAEHIANLYLRCVPGEKNRDTPAATNLPARRPVTKITRATCRVINVGWISAPLSGNHGSDAIELSAFSEKPLF